MRELPVIRDCTTCASRTPHLDDIPPSCYTCARSGTVFPLWRPITVTEAIDASRPGYHGAEPNIRVIDKATGRVLHEPPASAALDTQVGGDHYKAQGIQPVAYCHANNIPFIEGCVIKYVTRWRSKGRLADIDKAIHFLQILKELESAKSATESTT